jgi:hypothetical protein
MDDCINNFYEKKININNLYKKLTCPNTTICGEYRLFGSPRGKELNLAHYPLAGEMINKLQTWYKAIGQEEINNKWDNWDEVEQFLREHNIIKIKENPILKEEEEPLPERYIEL